MKSLLLTPLLIFFPFGNGADFFFNKTFGNFSSANYPNPYPNNVSDTWRIVVPSGYRVALYFTNFDLEDSFDERACSQDYVEIFSDVKSNNSIRLCGNPILFGDDSPQLKTQLFRSVNNAMTVRMKSDYSNYFPNDEVLSGFTANFYAEDIDECVELLKKKKESNDPENAGACEHYCNNYPGGFYCSCRKGYRLHSDGYSCVGDCLEVSVIDPQGTISSPGYPNSYPRLTNCSWKIKTDFGKNIEINFDRQFSIEAHDEIPCPYDYLKIFDSSGEIGSGFCGNVPPRNGSVIRSRTNWIQLQFYSDDLVEHKGFQVSFQERSITCEAPSPPHFGKILDVTLDGVHQRISNNLIPFSAIIRFDCELGFRLIGSGKVACLKDGSLSDVTPKCVPF